MAQEEDRQRTFTARLRDFREKYRIQVAVALAVLVGASFIAAEVVSAVKTFIDESHLLSYLTLLVVLDVAVAIYAGKGESGPRIARNQDEALPRLLEAVPNCRHDSVELLEYAGATILPLIREIQREGVHLRMLVQHPDEIAGIQKQRLLATLDTIINSIFEDDLDSVEIRCYHEPYTLRARRLGEEVLELGWLTPDRKHNTTYGHQNPSILLNLSDGRKQYLRAFFDRTFADLWDSPTTENALTVLRGSHPT